MAMYYECLEHGFAVAGVPAYDGSDDYIDDMIDEHERMHAEEARAAGQQPTIAIDDNQLVFGAVTAPETQPKPKREKWRIHRDENGWWIAERGDTTAACLTWEQAKLIVDLATLTELAGDEWAIRRYADRVELQEHGNPLTHRFFGTTSVGQASTYLRTVHTSRERRRELARDRDRALAEVDVITDHLNRDTAALAKEVSAG